MAKTLHHPSTEATLTNNSSLETQVFLAFRYRTPNRYKLIDKLTRANIAADEELTDKTIYLSEKSKKLLRAILKKFFRGETVLLNNKYITEVTRCKAGQNKNILAELENILDIKYYRLFKNNGVFFSYHYHFQLHPEILNELGLAGHKDIKSMAQFFVLSYINNKEAFNKSNRSNVQAHESNLLQNAVSLASEEIIEPKENSKVIPLKPKPLCNKRKKLTNAKIKANRAKLYKFKQYQEPKSLSDHYPLTTEDCSELQSSSGRNFTLNAMNEILLDISRKPKESRHKFPSKAAFMSYMSKVYRYEGRDTVKTANTSFKLLTRATKAEIIQHTTQAERESYLNSVEQQAITHRSDENQYRAKLGNRLKPSQAYDFLSSLRTVKRTGSVFQLHIAKVVDLTEYSLEMILQEAKAVGGYRGVEKLEFIVA